MWIPQSLLPKIVQAIVFPFTLHFEKSPTSLSQAQNFLKGELSLVFRWCGVCRMLLASISLHLGLLLGRDYFFFKKLRIVGEKRSLIIKTVSNRTSCLFSDKNGLPIIKYKLFCPSNLELICAMFLLFIIFCVISCSAD